MLFRSGPFARVGLGELASPRRRADDTNRIEFRNRVNQELLVRTNGKHGRSRFLFKRVVFNFVVLEVVVVQIVLIKVVVESLTIEGLIEIVVEIFIVAGVFGRSRHAVAFKVALSLRDRNADEKQSWVEPISPETRSAFLPQSDRAT